MKIDKEEELLSLLENVNDDIDRYDSMSFILAQTDSVDKVRRYGFDGYKRRFLENPKENITRHMQSFIYLKNMENMLENTKEYVFDEIDRLSSSSE